VFYVFNTHVDGGGNFVVTARDPAGPWSDPVWLPDLVNGIDPSMFVDDDGRAYVLNNGPPDGPAQYEGHRAIWIQEFDRRTLATIGPRKVLVNGGIDLAKRPIWIEGPHLFKHEGWYYLSCAEGGTGPQHSQVILRSRSPWGPFVAGPNNPILTQRDLPEDRVHPVTNAGHADLVQARDGTWWATFLGSRVYDKQHYNTGRETFLLPVTWHDGWPRILQPGIPIPTIVKGPSFMRESTQAPLSGNFTWRDDFANATLEPAWMQLRNDGRTWFDLTRKRGSLLISPRPAFDGKTTPALLARRQQHLSFDASLALQPPTARAVAAGLMAFQNESHWFFLGVRRDAAGMRVFLEEQHGATPQLAASAPLRSANALQLKVSADQRRYSFWFRVGDGEWQALATDADGSILSTDVAGGFVGAVLGPYVRSE
jgi:alpha-N-arabinofuranosidase